MDAFEKYLKEWSMSAHTLKSDQIDYFIEIFNSNYFFDALESVTSFAHTLCGLFALIFVANLVWKSWSNGSQLEISKIFKPLVIGFCIMNFNIVVGCVDFVISGIGSVTQDFSDACSKKSAEQFGAYAANSFQNSDVVKNNDDKRSIDEQASENLVGDKLQSTQNNITVAEGSKSYEDETLEKLGLLVDLPEEIAKYVGEFFIARIQQVCIDLAGIVMVCILFMGFLGKSIFFVFGPFLFAMELIPGMEGRITGFFKKYITYALYPCCINILNGVLITAMIALCDSSDVIGTNLVVHTTISIIAIFMFCAVPSIVNQLMDTASNQLGSHAMIPISYAANQLGNKFASSGATSGAKSAINGAAAVATGGASSVVSAGASMAANTASNMGKQAASGSNLK